jgi:hypothetical protein
VRHTAGGFGKNDDVFRSESEVFPQQAIEQWEIVCRTNQLVLLFQRRIRGAAHEQSVELCLPVVAPNRRWNDTNGHQQYKTHDVL